MKILIYIPALFLSLLLAAPAHATITVLGQISQGGENVTTITINTTFPAGENTLMCAIAHTELGAFVDTPDPVWNTSETFIQHNAIDTSGADNTEIWCLVGPTPGTFDFVINFTTSNNHMVALVFFAGVDGSDPVGATPTGEFSTGTTDDVLITTTKVNSMLLVAASWGERDVTLTPTAPLIKQYQVSGTGGGPASSKVTGSAATRLVTTIQEYTNTYTSTDSFNYSMLVIELNETVDAGGVHQRAIIAGVHQNAITAGVHQNSVNGP